MTDDDVNAPAPASDGVPAGDKTTTTEPKPEGDKPEAEAEETETTTTSDDDVGDEPDDDDDTDDDEGDEEEGEGDDDEGRPKRKASRAERYRRQAERLKAENDALRSRPGGGSLPSNEAALVRAIEQKVLDEIGPPPRQEEFRDAQGNPDYIRFHDEQQAWLHERRAVTRDVKKQFLGALESENARVGELVTSHKERVQRFRTKVKDFDEVMARATTPVAPHVERLLLESKRSDRITYHLAKNQAKLAQLNRMSSEEVAREIGRIEGRLSQPPQAKPTKARKPIAPLRGGGASQPNLNAARDAWLKKTYGEA